MRAVILAAGFGTRLWPLTEDRTKPAIPFLNRPLITYSVEYLAAHGLCDLVVNLHHQPDSIRDALGDGSRFGANIHYSYEEEILGTSGALDRVRDLLLDSDFVVINGKIVTDIDLQAALREHRERRALATLVLRENASREHFSIVEVDERGHISRFAGFPKPLDDDSKTGVAPLMFTGIQVLSPRIFEYIPRSQFSHSVTDVYPRAMEAGEAIIAHIASGMWYEMSTLSRYLEANMLFCREQGCSVVSGEDCVIEDGAVVEKSVLWQRVRVERGARVRECILADGVRIPAGSVFERAAIVRRDIVDEFERGETAGENVIVPL
ncbi:MAG: NDP-sugar synthase [Blastocatellia bacterium]|nr:NDP-sugar synthase [Blastocatellia bacterium]